MVVTISSETHHEAEMKVLEWPAKPSSINLHAEQCVQHARHGVLANQEFRTFIIPFPLKAQQRVKLPFF